MNTNTEELASLYVLDKLSPDEQRIFEERLETDTELVLLVRDLETAMEDQIRALPQSPVPDHIFANIELRIHNQSPFVEPRPVISIPWSTFAGWGMVATLLLGIGLTLLFTARKPDSGVLNGQPVVLVVGMNSVSSIMEAVPSVMATDDFENFVQLAQMAENYWDHPEELPETEIKSPLANTLSSGYAVFDPQNKQGFIAIQNLPKQQAGKNYFLWLRDSESKVLECAGIIPMQDKNQGLYFFELEDSSPLSSTRVTFFVTEEEASEPKLNQPRGALVLGSDHI